MAFNWALKAQGKNVLNTEIESIARAKAAKEEEIQNEKDRVIREQRKQEHEAQQARSALIAEKYANDLKLHQKELDALRVKQEERAKRLTREKGHWESHSINYADESEKREPDLEFNERVVKFVQLWLTVFGDIIMKNDISIAELEQLFYKHYCPWLIKRFSRCSNAIESHIRKTYPTDDYSNNDHVSPAMQYQEIQNWVSKEEKIPGARPWQEYDVWTPAKWITWKNVFRVLTKNSKTFPGGIAILNGNKLRWNVACPYETVYVKNKPLSEAQMRRRAQQLEDDYY